MTFYMYVSTVLSSIIDSLESLDFNFLQLLFNAFEFVLKEVESLKVKIIFFEPPKALSRIV